MMNACIKIVIKSQCLKFTKAEVLQYIIERSCCYYYSLVPRPSISTGLDVYVYSGIITSVHEEGSGNFYTVLCAPRM